MADSALDKMRDQCLELVLEILPVSQVIFLILACAVSKQLDTGSGRSVSDALSHVSLKNLFSLDVGILWDLDLKSLMLIFVVVFVNAWIFKASIRKSFARIKIEQALSGWMGAAVSALAHYSTEEKGAVSKSIGAELSRRMRRYASLRLVFELIFSLVVLVIYGSVLLVLDEGVGELTISGYDCAVFMVAFVLSVAVHIVSIRYAIEKIVPLQVYLSAASGEISFFYGMD